MMRLHGHDLAHIACALREKAARDREALAAAGAPSDPPALGRLAEELERQAKREDELADAIECASAIVIEH